MDIRAALIKRRESGNLKKTDLCETSTIYAAWNQDELTRPNELPRFHTKVPTVQSPLQQKLLEEARALFIEQRNENLLDNEDLKKLWMLLEEHITPPANNEDHHISFLNFEKVKNACSSKFKLFFSAKIYSKMYKNDVFGRISIRHYFNYVMRKVWLNQTRIGLSFYDNDGLGYLGENELANYILELIPTLPQLDGLEESFLSFYVCTAVRKFCFFLDPLRINKIKIQDILVCSFLDDLLELRDESLPKDAQDANWFSAPSALRVYGQYLNLDIDHNGMLSKRELLRYGSGTLTYTFINRVFQECLTYDKEMDYKAYLDFVLALENKKDPEALKYFFKVLDLDQKQYLTVFDLSYFFRAIQDQMKLHGQELVPFEDVKDEIFDMVRPADPTKITLKDLITSGQGDTVINILIDFNGFWSYENREVLAADNIEEAEV